MHLHAFSGGKFPSFKQILSKVPVSEWTNNLPLDPFHCKKIGRGSLHLMPSSSLLPESGGAPISTVGIPESPTLWLPGICGSVLTLQTTSLLRSFDPAKPNSIHFPCWVERETNQRASGVSWAPHSELVPTPRRVGEGRKLRWEMIEGEVAVATAQSPVWNKFRFPSVLQQMSPDH